MISAKKAAELDKSGNKTLINQSRERHSQGSQSVAGLTSCNTTAHTIKNPGQTVLDDNLQEKIWPLGPWF